MSAGPHNGFDLGELRLKVERTREFVAHEGGRRFELRYPTPLETQRLARRHADGSGRVEMVGFSRDIVAASILGWDCQVGDAHPESKTPAEPLPVLPETIAMVLEQQPAWTEGLAAQILERQRARQEALGAARGNSQTASDGSAGAAAASSTPSASAH